MDKFCSYLYITILFIASITAICIHTANLKIKVLEEKLVEKENVIQEFRKG